MTTSTMNTHQQHFPQDSTSLSQGGNNAHHPNAVFERLLQQNRTPSMNNSFVGGPSPGTSSAGMPSDSVAATATNSSSSPSLPGAPAVMNHQDFLSAQHQRERRMLAALQQQQHQQQQHQQQQQTQRQISATMTSRGLPVLQSMAGGHAPGQRFMVDDFGAGALLSRQEQEFLLSRYNQSAAAAVGHNHHQSFGLPGHPAEMDLSHPSKLADFLLAKQAAALNGPPQRMPKLTRLPCQARGMKADHNSSTAFFEIPEDARHGQHLLCSHPSCRAAGVKFRYCLYCKKPVTKQNFRSRHLHADLDPNNKNKASNVNLDRKRASPDPLVCQPVPVKLDAGAASVVKNETEEPSTKRIKTSEEHGEDALSSTEKDQEDSCSLDSVGRRRRWMSLLKERPSGLGKIHPWIGEVLSISNPELSISTRDSPVPVGEDSSPLDAIQESRWNTLFDQRPPADAGDAASTKWLIQVLETSCSQQQQQEGKTSVDMTKTGDATVASDSVTAEPNKDSEAKL